MQTLQKKTFSIKYQLDSQLNCFYVVLSPPRSTPVIAYLRIYCRGDDSLKYSIKINIVDSAAGVF